MTSAAGSDGRDHRIAGVMGVMTYPPFRREGHASAVMRKVGEYILSTDAEVGILFTTHDLDAFYKPLGWREADAGQVLVRNHEPDDVVMLFGDTSLLPGVVRLDFQW
jgi:predicted GNAT family acetyltransferase